MVGWVEKNPEEERLPTYVEKEWDTGEDAYFRPCLAEPDLVG